MKIVKQKMITSSVKYSKVEFHNKHFKRFQYQWKGQVLDILWLTDNGNFIPESFEDKLEKEFKKVG